ncbi:hypothetical protein GCG54_00014512 [Colletotrichum gloeosporioides]|uniref:SMP-30/Gluconolactonase/LRE-like region domain-containing protein n=1 Tax=Colletotrichum gloeosporioides TaxID=474922 RepID=A0A8H4FRG1_COLGL|nr:uncharacterized protein GCG54_00014512 [Colletotrichum gloeosporioides]KAF3811760.1 hypothetical protein GCG54_00014512 [Colletotrichum gloeosporioides]
MASFNMAAGVIALLLTGAVAQALPDGAPTLPQQAQIIDQLSQNVLEEVLPPYEANASTEFLWRGVNSSSLKERPFHIYSSEFYEVIGSDPSLTLIATSESDPIFHEAVTWNPTTDEMFFVQNAGDPDAGTGLNKSSIIQKISLLDAEELRNGTFGATAVPVHTVPSTPQVINPNGGTNYKGNLVFAGSGQGDRLASALYLMNPVEPYNTTVLVNNFFGRAFNSLNDVAVNPRNLNIYFTDTLYGYLQNFRPAPGLRNQVYRLDPSTGSLSVVADGFTLPNGITFSPNGEYAYVTDTGMAHAFFGENLTDPSTIYRYNVEEDGTWENRKTFAYVSPGIPDGIHCDSKGNVYAGCGDGIHVWNPSGKLIGKIYFGSGVSNFQFAGDGRMVIMGRTKLFYATLGASGAPIS